jgi:hypothetical protein
MFELTPFRDTPYDLQFAFAGKMFQWQYNSGFITGITNLQIKTSTGEITHIVARSILTSSTGMNVKLVENPVISSTGTVNQLAYNVDRRSGTTSKTVIASNVTSTGGTVIESNNLVSGTIWEQISPEIILQTDSYYNIRITNTGSTNIPIDFNFVWYESGN